MRDWRSLKMASNMVKVCLIGVAQVSNLLYRSASSLRGFGVLRRTYCGRCPADWKSATSPESFRGTQVGNLRYAVTQIEWTAARPQGRPPGHPTLHHSNTPIRRYSFACLRHG